MKQLAKFRRHDFTRHIIPETNICLHTSQIPWRLFAESRGCNHHWLIRAPKHDSLIESRHALLMYAWRNWPIQCLPPVFAMVYLPVRNSSVFSTITSQCLQPPCTWEHMLVCELAKKTPLDHPNAFTAFAINVLEFLLWIVCHFALYQTAEQLQNEAIHCVYDRGPRNHHDLLSYFAGLRKGCWPQTALGKSVRAWILCRASLRYRACSSWDSFRSSGNFFAELCLTGRVHIISSTIFVNILCLCKSCASW